MQTFLPYPDFAWSSGVLDDRRLGKQRVETFQILRALTWPTYAWKNHPATRMWRGFVPALVAYGLANCAEWVRRGYGDTVRESLLEFTGGEEPDVERLRSAGQLPPWLGDPALHVSHRSALVRKDPAHYRRHFPEVPDDLPYVWPAPAFPQWPVRRGRRAGLLPLQAALAELGLPTVRAGQAAAVAALVAGRDVLLCAAPGHGGTTTGLLAALVLPGTTVHVTPDPDETLPLEPPELPPAAEVAGEASREALTARAPSPADAAAVADEVALPPELAFVTPARLAEPATLAAVGRPSLLVVDRADALSAAAAGQVRAARAALGAPPVLAVAGALGRAARARVVDRLGLQDPVPAGGGWDRPGVSLAVQVAPTEPARRRRLTELVADAPGPGLVVAGSRARAEQVAAHLRRQGLAAEPYAAGMRPSRLEAATAAYRSRRLRALVLAGAEEAPDLGRAPVRFLVTVDPPHDLAAYHRQLTLLGDRDAAATLLLLATDDLEPGLRDYVSTSGCRRGVLLDAFGEPLAAPCGRCDNDELAEAPPPQVVAQPVAQ